MAMNEPAQPGDLGFTVCVRKSGDVEIRHHGRLAAVLRGKGAKDFLARITDPAAPQAQQLMARLTGNYRRGNERRAAEHPRNRRGD